MSKRRRFTIVQRFCKRCDVETEQRKRRLEGSRRFRHECKGCEARRRAKDPVKLLYKTMIYRCTNPRANNWQYYGGAGVTVCQRWLDSYEAFLRDVGPRPSPGHSLDRVDVSLGYEPGNVRWATKDQQSHDHRKYLVVHGIRKLIEDWIAGTGLTRDEVIRRLKDDWTPGQAVLLAPGASQHSKRWA